MSLKLNTASGGSITLQEADTASNLTLTVPAQAGSIVTADSSGNVGIGTNSPLTASGYTALTVRNNTNGGIVEVKNSNVALRMQLDADNVGRVGTYTNHELLLIANSTEQARFTTDGNFKFNSGYGSVATAYGCRAWVNFNGTGTVAIRASGNVSSITDSGAGIYIVNFSNNMPDANYSVCGSTTSSGNNVFKNRMADRNTTSAVDVLSVDADTGSAADDAYVCVAIFR
jgi:hypothetical protein